MALIGTTATAGPENYKHIGERLASGQIETPYYSFQYSPPSETYGVITWDAYRDKTEKRNTVMVIGLRGYDTYALSVLYKGQATPAQGALDAAKQQYPSGSFTAGPNPSCVNTPLDRPFQLDGRMLNFLAICVDKETSSIYELSISWQSLILAMKSLDTVASESESCVASKAQDPSARCPDYIGTYAGSYRTFLTSFHPSGK
jgi:hypothetical protein